MDIASIRTEYGISSLSENNIPSDPFTLFQAWFQIALDAKIHEANAMVLSTSIANKPSSRVVLLKEIDNNSFVFFTNYNSKKGQSIEANPNVSLCFFWKELERQVRVEGIARKISEEKSKEYFYSRPEQSQIGAIVSPQSMKIESREILEFAFENYSKEKISKPQNWGGYAVEPTMIEFWQGGKYRLHDRICYEFENNIWNTYRLAP
jgi:pyridoxamine 5'-phosphate oxidase